MKKRIFGELELAILQVFKQRARPHTVREILNALGSKDKYTTIMTVMNRLVEKGELQRKREGLSYRYSVQPRKPAFSLLEKWRQKIFGGKSALMISYLLESAQDITREELDEIQEMIEQAKREGDHNGT